VGGFVVVVLVEDVVVAAMVDGVVVVELTTVAIEDGVDALAVYVPISSAA